MYIPKIKKKCIEYITKTSKPPLLSPCSVYLIGLHTNAQVEATKHILCVRGEALQHIGRIGNIKPCCCFSRHSGLPHHLTDPSILVHRLICLPRPAYIVSLVAGTCNIFQTPSRQLSFPPLPVFPTLSQFLVTLTFQLTLPSSVSVQVTVSFSLSTVGPLESPLLSLLAKLILASRIARATFTAFSYRKGLWHVVVGGSLGKGLTTRKEGSGVFTETEKREGNSEYKICTWRVV